MGRQTKLNDRYILDGSERERCCTEIIDIVATKGTGCDGKIVGLVQHTGNHSEEDCAGCSHDSPFPGVISIWGPGELEMLNGVVVNNEVEMVGMFQRLEEVGRC